MLTICLKNPISVEKMKTQASGINQTAYLQFLNGKEFDPEMLSVNYKNVTIDMNEYVVDNWIAWRNGSEMYGPILNSKMFTPSYAVYRSRFYDCYTLQVPNNKQIKKFFVFLNASVFTFLNQKPDYDMIASLHYPNHFLTSEKNIKYLWPKREYFENFAMRFIVNGMEVIRRRNKANRPCDNNWIQYDRKLHSDHIQNVGCRAPYHALNQEMDLCSTKELMKKVLWNTVKEDHGMVPPCKSMTKLFYTYEESSLLGTQFSSPGQIWIGLFHLNNEFKEILQTRYYFIIL